MCRYAAACVHHPVHITVRTIPFPLFLSSHSRDWGSFFSSSFYISYLSVVVPSATPLFYNGNKQNSLTIRGYHKLCNERKNNIIWTLGLRTDPIKSYWIQVGWSWALCLPHPRCHERKLFQETFSLNTSLPYQKIQTHYSMRRTPHLHWQEALLSTPYIDHRPSTEW